MITHFGTQSLLGVQYQLSVELMAIELGIGPQPVCANYTKYQSRVMACLMKEMWARMGRFNLSLEIHTLQLVPSQKGDRWFMIAIEDAGFVGKEAEIINRFRLHQQVVYESDVFEADCRKLDVRYWHRRRDTEQWSDWKFTANRKLL